MTIKNTIAILPKPKNTDQFGISSEKGLLMTSAERLALYKRRMTNAGFRRISVWISSELAGKLASDRGPGECGGRTLERLLLGQAAKRPEFPYGSIEDEK